MPTIPARKHLARNHRRRDPVGYEQGLGLLIRSGVWARLSASAKSLATVLLEFGEKDGPLDDTLRVRMAYRTLARYSGVRSHNAIHKGLVDLKEMGFLVLPSKPTRRSPERESSTYLITPNSDELRELAEVQARQTQQEIDAEKDLRRRQRADRIRAHKKEESGRATLQY